MTKLFEYPEEKIPTEQELALVYDNTQEAYKAHILAQAGMQNEYIKLGEKAWILSEELRKSTFVKSDTSDPEKRMIYSQLMNDRGELVKNWEAKELTLREEKKAAFYNLISPALTEIDEWSEIVRKTSAVSLLGRKFQMGLDKFLQTVRTNIYSIQACRGYLKDERDKLYGMINHNPTSEAILKKIEEIKTNAPSIEWIEFTPSNLQLEFLQQITNMAVDTRTDELVKADPKSVIHMESPITELKRKEVEAMKLFDLKQRGEVLKQKVGALK